MPLPIGAAMAAYKGIKKVRRFARKKPNIGKSTSPLPIEPVTTEATEEQLSPELPQEPQIWLPEEKHPSVKDMYPEVRYTLVAQRKTFLKKAPGQGEGLPITDRLEVPAHMKLEVVEEETYDQHHSRIQTPQIGTWLIYHNDWVAFDDKTDVPTMADIDWYDFQCPISKYFTVGEVSQYQYERLCTVQEFQENAYVLAQKMDELREEWGSPWHVTSWYRPPKVNASVGGAKKSQHLTASAADVYPTKGDIGKFQSWMDERWDGALGYGARRGFVHLDLRQGRIRFNY